MDSIPKPRVSKVQRGGETRWVAVWFSGDGRQYSADGATRAEAIGNWHRMHRHRLGAPGGG